MNRRKILKALSLIPLVSSIPMIGFAKKGDEKSKNKDKVKDKVPANLIGENEPLAKAMKYQHDAGKVKGMRTNKKAFCNNCDRWNKCNPTDSKCKPLKNAKVEYAPCNLFANKVVKDKGWCLSWQAKS